MPLAWWVLDGVAPLGGATIAAALLFTLLWVDAHGIHLAANAIGDVFAAGAPRDAFYATPAGDLDHFLDEGIGHWEWHAGWAGWSALLLGVAIRRPDGRRAGSWFVPAVAGLIHGVTFFFVTAEGGTAVLGAAISMALVAVGGVAIWRGSSHPVVRFLVAASVVTLALDVLWAIANGGRLVEPCTVLGC
jgi:hypothetical protein